MNNVAVGKEASQRTGSEIYFQTYHGLLRQKEKIDNDIFRLQKKFSKIISKAAIISPVKRAKYIPRLKNTTTLAKAIRECMIPKKEMIMDDILKSLSEKGLYHTNSKYFYTMVNNKLNRDKLIKKVSRGVFMHMPQVRRKSSAAA